MKKNLLSEELGRINKLGGTPVVKEDTITFDSKFTTPITGREIDVYNIRTGLNLPPDAEVSAWGGSSDTKGTVIWQLDPDMRNWGIKSMGISVLRVIASIAWEHDVTEDEQQEGILEFDTQLPQFKDWSVENELKFTTDGGLYPNGIDIDFISKRVVVN
jgi:hypothetical protein